MIEVVYKTKMYRGEPRIVSIKVTGHAVGSNQNLLAIRTCAGVSAITYGSEMMFDLTHTIVGSSVGYFEVTTTSYSDKRDYVVLELIVIQLMRLYRNFSTMFKTFEEVKI